MKRILSILMTISMIFMLMVPVQATEEVIVTVESVAESFEIGEDVTLAVTIENNTGFTDFGWEIVFDRECLELVGFENEPSIGGFTANQVTAVVTAAQTNPYIENGKFFDIKFRVKENAPSGETTVAIYEVPGSGLYNGNNGVDVCYVDGIINIVGAQNNTPGAGGNGGSTGGGAGSLPSGSLPSGSLPSGSLPSGSLPSGSLPSGSLPSGSLPSGSLPSGSLPSGSLPSGDLPGGDTPQGDVVTSLGNGSVETPVVKFTVTFENNEGTGIIKTVVEKGEKLERPEDPVKTGFKFAGWYEDAGLTKLYNFNKLVTENFTLYAKWVDEDKETETETEEGTGTVAVFTDVKETDWFAEAVKFAYENNLINGVSDTEFAPNDKVTRAVLVEILYRLEGKPATNKSIPYSDVAMDKYYADAVSWADQNGIIKGVSENEFAPEVNITREQIATIIYRYAQYNNYDTSVVETTDLSSFKDADQISDYALDAMKYVVGIGIISGRPGAILAPKDYASRAEFVQILYNYFK